MHSDRVWQGSIQARGLNMQWAVWIKLSDGTRSRYGVYESREEAHRIAGLIGGVVQPVV